MEGRPLPCLPPASHSLRALFEALPRRSPAPRLCRPILAGTSPRPLQTKVSKASAPNIGLFCSQQEFFASSLIGVVPLSVSFCSKTKTGGGAAGMERHGGHPSKGFTKSVGSANFSFGFLKVSCRGGPQRSRARKSRQS